MVMAKVYSQYEHSYDLLHHAGAARNAVRMIHYVRIGL